MPAFTIGYSPTTRLIFTRWADWLVRSPWLLCSESVWYTIPVCYLWNQMACLWNGILISIKDSGEQFPGVFCIIVQQTVDGCSCQGIQASNRYRNDTAGIVDKKIYPDRWQDLEADRWCHRMQPHCKSGFLLCQEVLCNAPVCGTRREIVKSEGFYIVVTVHQIIVLALLHGQDHNVIRNKYTNMENSICIYKSQNERLRIQSSN